MVISGTDSLEVPTIYKAYAREYPHKILPYMVQYLHVRILKLPLNYIEITMKLSSFKLAWYTMNIWNSEKNHPPSNYGNPSTPWSQGKTCTGHEWLGLQTYCGWLSDIQITSFFFWCIGVSH